MDTNHPSAASYCSIEITGPFADYDDIGRALGPLHPYHLVEDEVLHYYDQPVVAICHVEGDDRPRLDILIGDDSQGPDGERVYTSTRHNLVFDCMETLVASLHIEGVPTIRSYELAEEIVRYRSIGTQIGHPHPRHAMVTSALRHGEIPDDELPYATHVAQGLPTPTNRDKENRT